MPDPHRHVARACLKVAGFVLLATCTEVPLTDPAEQVAVKLGFGVANARTVATAGPILEVMVLDADGAVVTGSIASVTLAIMEGTGKPGAVLGGTLTQSAVNGVATFADLTIDKVAGNFVLTATADGLASADSDPFMVNPGPPARLAVTGQPTKVSAGAMIPGVQVTLQDALGNPVTTSEVNVAIALTPGTGASGAVIGGTLVRMTSGGIASFPSLSIDKTGSDYTLTATATGMISAATEPFAVIPGAPAKLSVTVQPGASVSGEPIAPAIEVFVQDALGNAVSSSTASIALAITAGTGSAGAALVGTLTRSAVAGKASFGSVAVNKVGTGYTLTATSNGLASAVTDPFAVLPISVVAGPPTKLALAVAPSPTAGSRIAFAAQPVVQIQDANGNPVALTGKDITVTMNGSGSIGGSTTVTTSISGAATFSNLSIASTVGLRTLSFGATGLASVTAGVTVMPGLPATVAHNTGSGQFARVGTAAATPLSVKVTDADGNSVPDVPVSFSVTAGGGTLTGGNAVTSATGIATAGTWTLGTVVGTNSVTATVAALSPASVQFVAGAQVGPAAILGVGAGNNQSAPAGHVILSPSVIVTDAYGNPVDGIVVNVAVSSGGGTVVAGSGTTTRSGGPGIALMGTWALGLPAGVNTLTATVPGLTGSPLTLSATAEVWTGPKSIAASGANSCALMPNGSAYCWGLNARGSVGDGTMAAENDPNFFNSNNRLKPTPVSGGHVFESLALGSEQSCGLTAAGTAWCWGFNAFGQVGDNSTTNRSIPVAVVGGLTFQSLAGASGTTCGIVVGGAAYCWGFNATHQLGNVGIVTGLIPVPVAGGLAFTNLAVGGDHVCGVTTAGAAYCWGYGGTGILGDGNVSNHVNPASQAVLGGLTFQSIVAGSRHTCGLTPAGKAYCWGSSVAGQVGDGSESPTGQGMPSAVSGGLTFTSLGAREDHTCGLATSGEAYCWGSNYRGPLGDGTLIGYRTVPTLVVGGLTYQSLAVGGAHNCGLSTTGAVYCWGMGIYEQLGDSPVPFGRSTVSAVRPP